METPLSCMYLMPNTQRASTDATTLTMSETWKGPWSEIKNLTDPKNSSIFGVKLIPGMARPQELDRQNSWKAEFSAPKASNSDADVVWTIQDVKASEIVAGELGQIEIQYIGNVQGSGQAGQFQQIKPTTWSLSWGSTNVSPLTYCLDQTGGRASEVLACQEKPHPTVAELQANGYQQATDEDARYSWWEGSDDIYRSIGMLTDSTPNGGRQIYEYMEREIKPLFHYPIIQRREFIKEAPAVISSDYRNLTPQKLSAIDRVDYMTPLSGAIPDGCPFTGLSGWEFLCVEDNYEGYFQGTFGYNRTTIWWGAKSIDKNFYGQDGVRWEPYSPPAPDPGN